MPSRKRSSQAVEGDSEDAEPSLLHRIRNMWQFANLCQWIYIFGKAAKIDESIEIEEMETECLKPTSTILSDIGLALLKLVSSHRGLTHDIFDDQVRKQYLAKAPDNNPFGNDDAPVRFEDFDVFTKIRVLQQLTQWIMIHPERIRDKMEEQKDPEQTSWRIEPCGWDAEDRTYFVLDDNRVYRLTNPPPSLPTLKSRKSKASRTSRRSSKRRRTTTSVNDEQAEEDNEQENSLTRDDGLGGMVWECLAVTLNDVQVLVETFRKTRDGNEKILRKQLEEHLIPILEKQEEARRRKEAQRERELLNLAKMANAKRSSRLAIKAEQHKQDEREKEEEQQRREAEAASRREGEAHRKAERERERRIHSREKRLRDREARRIQHEDELAQLSEDSKNLTGGSGRGSERRIQAEIEKKKQALKDLDGEEEDWVFDCVCGLYGQVDDGTHSVACERCNIWQHSKCLGISETDAERPEFRFVCTSCRHREEARNRARPTIKLKVNHPGTSPTQVIQQPNEEVGGPPSVVSNKEHPTKYPKSDPAERTMRPNRPEQKAASPASSTNSPHANNLGPGLHLDTTNPDAASVNCASAQLPIKAANSMRCASQDVAITQNGFSSGSRPLIVTTPGALSSSPNGSGGIPDGRTVESTLSTPDISRDIYRAAHVQNGTLPAQAGLSPTKHSPPRPVDQLNTRGIKSTTSIIPPITSLSPSPPQQVLTPPSKQAEPLRSINGSSPGSKPSSFSHSPTLLRNSILTQPDKDF